MEGPQQSQLFYAQYQAIAAKLKKKILKKPNYKEATESYGSLSKALDNNEWYQYAGLCREAMARCAHISANVPGEAEAWVEAGRMFLKAEAVYRLTSAPSYEDNIHAASHCFLLAIQTHKNAKNFTLAAKFSLEIAGSLKSLGKFGDAQLFYERAASLQQEVMGDTTVTAHTAPATMNLSDLGCAIIAIIPLSFSVLAIVMMILLR